MQTLLNSAQMRLADAFTLNSQRISSLALMESAALAFVKAFMEEVSDKETAIAVLCGKGNNGADGLAIARILNNNGYTAITVYLLAFSLRETEEYSANLHRLEGLAVQLLTINQPDELGQLKALVIIDAVLGSGLNKPLTGLYQEMAVLLNRLNRQVIAVDIPTGFPAEGLLNKNDTYLKADLVICFQRPKINFFFPESVEALNRFRVMPIGLDEGFIEHCDSPYKLIDASAIRSLVKSRKPFTHKGTYGHALIIAGQQETMGAALLAAKACLYGGAGLTTVSIPETGLTALNTALPEVMYLNRAKLNGKDELKKFKAIAVGPGLGKGENSINLLQELLELDIPLIIDADALNILGERRELMEKLTPGSILTPHLKEFDQLFGLHHSWWARLQTAREKAVENECIIVLKNQYTFIIDQKGKVIINTTGNPAMAQGGMGDVLTGLIASFYAQGYNAHQSAFIACYLHGKSGDELAAYRISVTASAVAEHTPLTLKELN